MGHLSLGEFSKPQSHHKAYLLGELVEATKLMVHKEEEISQLPCNEIFLKIFILSLQKVSNLSKLSSIYSFHQTFQTYMTISHIKLVLKTSNIKIYY